MRQLHGPLKSKAFLPYSWNKAEGFRLFSPRNLKAKTMNLRRVVYIVYRQSPSGPVDPSFGALTGRLKFTVRRHECNKDSLSLVVPYANSNWGILGNTMRQLVKTSRYTLYQSGVGLSTMRQFAVLTWEKRGSIFSPTLTHISNRFFVFRFMGENRRNPCAFSQGYDRKTFGLSGL
jgi:hypothetical protein